MTRLIIAGASVRAAAFSALRAGFTPWCADLFADADLRRVCEVRAIAPAGYPQDFASVLQDAPPGPWIYTGGLENHPKLIERISARRELLGNGPSVLRRVRSSSWLSKTAARHRLPYPEVWRSGASPPCDRRWLVKPMKGAGGTQVRFLTTSFDPRHFYLQEYVAGLACSAVFRVQPDRAKFMGATRQIIGPEDFRYRGSIGPIPLESRVLETLQLWADVLVAEAGLGALFGLDYILQDGVPWLIEVNPRYTASVEILEHACAWHAFQPPHDRGFPSRARRADGDSVYGKAILFASEDVVVEEGPWHDFSDPRDWPKYADVPEAGTRVRPGQPILTVFAMGATEQDVMDRLAVESSLQSAAVAH